MSQNNSECLAKSTLETEYAKKFSLGHWWFHGPGSESKWNVPDTSKSGGEWDRVAEIRMINFSESGHRIFRATRALERWTLKSKWDGKLSFYFCGDCEIAEDISRTIVSIIQLSIYGAVTDMCEELALSNFRNPTGTGRYNASQKPESMTSRPELLKVSRRLLTNHRVQGDLLLDHKTLNEKCCLETTDKSNGAPMQASWKVLTQDSISWQG